MGFYGLDGIPYWHVIHDDNDEEDIDYEDLVKFRMYYLKNKQYSSSDEVSIHDGRWISPTLSRHRRLYGMKCLCLIEAHEDVESH